ncbi:MAG: hypothetical protein E6K56_02675 [Ignavibacteria bacterium]|nr:MAG: hypothetical protein E6K56_02675 [Ignavibacteria bacterium]
MDRSDARNRYISIVGLTVTILGLIFLLRNLDVIRIGNRWWALFFLIPISYLLSNVMHPRKDSQGSFMAGMRSSLIGLVTLSAVMLIFLLGLHWGVVWPILIVIAGLSLLLAR